MEQTVKEQLEGINKQIKDMNGIYKRAISRMGISENEFWIWYTLIIVEGEYSQRDICNMWNLSKQTVNTIITNMIRKNFVTLEAVPGTRNRKIIRLSQAGREYGERIAAPMATAERRAFERLSAADRAAIMKALAAYAAVLNEEING